MPAVLSTLGTPPASVLSPASAFTSKHTAILPLLEQTADPLAPGPLHLPFPLPETFSCWVFSGSLLFIRKDFVQLSSPQEPFLISLSETVIASPWIPLSCFTFLLITYHFLFFKFFFNIFIGVLTTFWHYLIYLVSRCLPSATRLSAPWKQGRCSQTGRCRLHPQPLRQSLTYGRLEITLVG